MKVKGLDGKDHVWKMRSGTGKSGLSRRALDLVREIWPAYEILEEVPIPGASSVGKLYLDIFIPAKKLAVEVHGPQHFEYTIYFYKTKREFLLAQNNDRLKIDWLKLNDIDLVELRFDNEKEWGEILNGHR